MGLIKLSYIAIKSTFKYFKFSEMNVIRYYIHLKLFLLRIDSKCFESIGKKLPTKPQRFDDSICSYPAPYEKPAPLDPTRDSEKSPRGLKPRQSQAPQADARLPLAVSFSFTLSPG